MVDRSNDATCLLGLAGLAVEGVARTAAGVRMVQLVTRSGGGALPGVSGNVDLGHGVGADPAARPALRRGRGAGAAAQAALALPNRECPQQSFTEQTPQVPAGMRTTTRLREGLAEAVEDGRDQSKVAVAYAVSWPTVQRALVAYAQRVLAEPEPMTVLGMDETRFGRPRWLPDGVHEDGRIRWRRTDPWETGFVDVTGEHALLGQVDGRSAAAVPAWLAEHSAQFRERIETVVIDPHAGYAAAVRAALPEARIAVDHFHLIMLGKRSPPCASA